MIIASKTNTRSDFKKDPAFKDLVASIKEKGIIVPLIVRKVGKDLEIVAGHRRFAAAQELGIADAQIPVHTVEMNDVEAREAQIIENLQRADVHPFEEALAYVNLIKLSKYEVVEVAAKVGKSETYVRNRLALYDIEISILQKMRAVDYPIAHALVIARLPKADQPAAYKFSRQYDRLCTLKEIRDYVAQRVFSESMKNPPWKNDAAARAEIAKITGLKGGEKNLFGEDAEEKIENPAEYARAMAAFLQLKVDEYKTAGKPLTLVSGDYSTKSKGVLGHNMYETGPGYNASKTRKCTDGREALIIEGNGVGKLLKICTDKQCPAHHYISDTPAEKASRKTNRKKEIAREKAKRDKDLKAMTAAVAKAKFPLKEKHLNALLELAIQRASHDVNQGIAKRREIELIKSKGYYGSVHMNLEASIRKAAKQYTSSEKVGLLFELLVPGYSPNYNEHRNKAMAML